METSQLKTTRKTKVKVVTDLSELSTIVEAVPSPAPVCAPSPAVLLSPSGKFMLVTAMHLRRSVLNGSDVKHCKFVLSADAFRKLTSEGLKHGVTWDEMLRGVITEQEHNPKPFANAAKFLPPSDEVN